MHASFRLSFLLILGLCLVLGRSSLLAAAAPKLEVLFPAGAARGETTTVTVSPTPAGWPVDIWVDRTGILITAEKEKGKLRVEVPAAALCGVYWLRLTDKEGASEMRPFVVGTLAESLEQEPNDHPRKPQLLTGSTTVNGRLAKAGDVDTYALTLKKGQTMVAALRAHSRLGSPMDSVMQICNEDGFVLSQTDDVRSVDPLIPFTAPRDGTYLIRLFAFPLTATGSIRFAGAGTFVYRLTVTTEGFIDYALPLALPADQSAETRLFGWNIPADAHSITTAPQPNGTHAVLFHPRLAEWLSLPVLSNHNLLALEENSPEQPQSIELPAVISGRIESPGDTDTFRFQGAKGQKIRLSVDSRKLGYPLDPLLRVTDSAGKVLIEIDDPRGQRTLRDSLAVFTVPADGLYDLTIRDLHHGGGTRYVYRLVCEEAKPDFNLKLAAGQFVLTAGKPLEIPVTIERLEKFSAEIEITARGLPAGVEVEPVTSAAKGATAKTVKLKLTAKTGGAAGTFEIVGQSKADPSISHTARFSVVSPLGEHNAAWLSVSPAKK